jgi:hypothetical protein
VTAPGEDGETPRELETLNSRQALWARPRKEVSDQEYHEFYKHISHDWTNPLETIRMQAEGTFERGVIQVAGPPKAWIVRPIHVFEFGTEQILVGVGDAAGITFQGNLFLTHRFGPFGRNIRKLGESVRFMGRGFPLDLCR